MTDQLQEELRAHLTRTADRAEVTPAPVVQVLHGIRSDRRRRTVIAAVAVTAAVVLGAATVSVVDGRAARTEVAADPQLRELLSRPTAGDLATDRDWVGRATDRIRGLTGFGVRSVLFAGRVGTGSAVLVAVDNSAGSPGLTLLGFTSPSTDPGALTESTSSSFDDPRGMPGGGTGPIGWEVVAGGGERYAVVLPGPGAGPIEVSGGPRYDASGRVDREYLAVPVADGAAVTRMPAATVWLPRARQGGAAVGFALTSPQPPSRWIGSVRPALQAQFDRPVDDDLTVSVLGEILAHADLAGAEIQPAFLGPEQPSGALTLAVRVRLTGGAVLQAVGLLDDRNPQSTSVTVPLVGRLVRGSDPERVPIAWADDLSFPGGGIRARARVVQQGAAEVRILDTGRAPCTRNRVLARGAAEDGLTTLEVDVPRACQDPAPEGESLISFSRIQAVTYDADGRELGRSPLMLSTDGALPDVG